MTKPSLFGRSAVHHFVDDLNLNAAPLTIGAKANPHSETLCRNVCRHAQHGVVSHVQQGAESCGQLTWNVEDPSSSGITVDHDECGTRTAQVGFILRS